MSAEVSGVPDVSSQYCHFFDDSAFEPTDRPGFRRRIITGDHLQLWFWRIAGGSTGSFLHRHDAHEQLGIVVRGALDFRIGKDEHDDAGTRTVLGPGDLYLAPRSVWHGDSIFIGDDEYGECWILDVFTPPRADVGPSAGDAVVRLGSDAAEGAEAGAS